MGRSPCCEKAGLKKGPWTPEEDQKLMAYIEEHGHGSWRALPAKAGLQRCGKSCRLRWTNYLRPDIKRGKFSLQEEQTIIQLHALLGNKWSTIAAHLPKRTDNEIKNYWNTHLKKRLTKMGIDPITHRPKTDAFGHSKDSSNLSHMAQWESARLEAEARLVRESKLQLVQNQLGSKPARLILNKISPQPSVPPCLDVLKAWQRSWSTNSQSDKDNPRIHNIYAMMLTTDDLESPTSTLCFPEGTSLPISPTAGTIFNDNLLPSTTTAPATTAAKSSVSCDSDEGPWKYLPKGEDNRVLSLQDDNIMMAVEAFRAAAGYNSNNDVMEACLNHDLLYDSNEGGVAAEEDNVGIINGDGGSCNVNFEENNKQYWNSLLNLVNDLPSGSPVF
ncbi:hypothetical protein L6164_020827 [Bauhinia variegata]|uniref:Uncharacterized protein n=1 Tax=Bauhinia variegata TaxID=167791 RepID=A0ACB9N1D9_BAUVA|nr:hypothetical protein L6164_020827 [Bauhinia variegata]